MKKFPAHLLLLAFAVFAFQLRGVDPMKATADDGQSQSEQNQNASAEFQRIDAELTKTYEHSLDEVEKLPAVREALIASQRAWLAFRDADGHYESVDSDGGSARTYYVNKRMTYLTRQRIYQLKTPFAQGWVESHELKIK